MSDAQAKKLRFWVKLLIFVTGVGFGASNYLNQYAQASDLDILVNRFDQHVIEAASKLGGISAQVKSLEDDSHWQREQLQRIADSVGAPRVAIPKHDGGVK